MANEEFPSFQKKEKVAQAAEKKALPLFIFLSAFLVTAFSIFLGFRFLVGAKTPRAEILGRVLSASPSRQASLLMEWMQNIDQVPDSSEWKPSALEESELLRFAVTKIPELKQPGTSPGLYALHVASWGAQAAESKDLSLLTADSLSEESTLALGLYFLRKKDFSQDSISYLLPFVALQSESLRKIAAAYFAQCASSGASTATLTFQSCKEALLKLLGDETDEVRWNSALGILRDSGLSDLYSQSERAQAESELGKLYLLVKNEDPTLLSRFRGAALESLATEVFKAKMALAPQEMKQDLKDIARSYSDLRIRNIARTLESKFQEK